MTDEQFTQLSHIYSTLALKYETSEGSDGVLVFTALNTFQKLLQELRNEHPLAHVSNNPLTIQYRSKFIHGPHI